MGDDYTCDVCCAYGPDEEYECTPCRQWQCRDSAELQLIKDAITVDIKDYTPQPPHVSTALLKSFGWDQTKYHVVSGGVNGRKGAIIETHTQTVVATIRLFKAMLDCEGLDAKTLADFKDSVIESAPRYKKDMPMEDRKTLTDFEVWGHDSDIESSDDETNGLVAVYVSNDTVV